MNVLSTLLIGEFVVGLAILQLMLFLTSLFLILLILIQRGKGGGLTGALGGGGGESAFGSKSGDAFTKITIGTAIFWITLCMVTIAAYNAPETAYGKRAAAKAAAEAEKEAAAAQGAATLPPINTSGSIGEPEAEAGAAGVGEADSGEAADAAEAVENTTDGDAEAADSTTGESDGSN